MMLDLVVVDHFYCLRQYVKGQEGEIEGLKIDEKSR